MTDDRKTPGIMIGVDIGGTFTDFAVVAGPNLFFTKVPSTPADPGQAVIDGLVRIHETLGIAPGDITRLVQGTTVSTNALLERKGALTGLITNRGFEDVLEIGRQNRSSLPGAFPIYDFNLKRPPPLVSRHHRLGVRGRISYNGGEIEPLCEEDVIEAGAALAEQGIRSIAVSLLGAYLDPSHEQRTREILERHHPESEVTLSSEVVPEFREYERTSTTVISAYLKPVMNRYLARLEQRLREFGVKAPLEIMQSNGGITTASDAGQRAVYTLLSGPAGGVQGARSLVEDKEQGSHGNLLTLDIGGTSTDLSLVVNGYPSFTSEARVGGYPVKTPMIEINTVGRGGGSIVRLDPAGGMQIGPDSAGADPGPVGYGRGGTEPTLTDAHLILGHLDPSARLGEQIDLDLDRSRSVFEEKIATPMGMAVEEAAQGAIDIAISEIRRAAGVISIEKGHDPRDFTLVAFGGAGPLYALTLAQEMDIPRAVIPGGPGVLSALGLLTVDVRHDYVRSDITPLDEADPTRLEDLFSDMIGQGSDELERAGFSSEDITFEAALDLRYLGQAYELEIPLGSFSPACSQDVFTRMWPGAEAVAGRFHRTHHRTYGHSAPEEPVQLVNLRLSALSEVEKPRLGGMEGASDPVQVQPRSRRPVYFPGEGYVDTPIFSRDDLVPGSEITGPAIIQEAVSTTLVPPGFSLTADTSGNLVATHDVAQPANPHGDPPGIDPISLQVLRNAFIAITEEMGMTLRKTGYSPNIKEREDCSTALFDAQCRIIAQADYPMQPGHLGAMIYSVQEAVATFPEGSWIPGDVVIQNDPHRGGNHLPDITLITPVFWEDELRGFAANRAHHADIGGAVPGSISGSSTEIYQEGFIIPPLKLYEGGRLNTAIMELFRANVRTPDERTGDLRAQMAANEKGRARLEDLYGRYGLQTVESAIDELICYSEKRMRHEIEQIPDGTYSFSDHMDDDGISPEPVVLRATVTVKGSDITFDFAGSAPQTLGPINSTEAITAGTIFFVLRCLTDPSIPPNEGCYRPIKILAPRGTVVNPEPPAAVVGGNLETAQRLCDVLIGAFQTALPDRVVAACNGQMCNVGIGGMDRRRDPVIPYAYYETIGGGFGARADADGIDGIHCHMTNTMNTPVEAIELAYPFMITHYSLLPGSSGAGRFRGGLGIRRDYKILGDDVTFTLLAERRKTRPYGLFGGKDGQQGVDILDPGTPDEHVIPGKHTVRLNPGQVVSIRTPGAGGHGDPLARDPERVRIDVLEGRVSEADARESYGVIMSGRTIDWEQTADLRGMLLGNQ